MLHKQNMQSKTRQRIFPDDGRYGLQC